MLIINFTRNKICCFMKLSRHCLRSAMCFCILNMCKLSFNCNKEASSTVYLFH